MNNTQFLNFKSSDNGGAILLEEGTKLTVNGGAVYASDKVEATILSGRITGNSGGAIYAVSDETEQTEEARNTRLYFGGSPFIFDNLTDGKQKNVVLSADCNRVIQTTEDGLVDSAKIGVYVIDGEDESLFKTHGLPGKPFGTFANENNLKSFVNDRNLTLYGVRNDKDGSDVKIYWLKTGVPIAFKKVDSFGAALAGATFTLYMDAECTQAYEKEPGESVSAVSADGKTTKDANNQLLKPGVVRFEEIPDGVYYMRETKADGTSGAPTGFAENGNIYVVLVGTEALSEPKTVAATVWDDKITAQIAVQAGRYRTDMADYNLTEEPKYAIFLINPATKKAVATPDIAKYGIMNISTAKRKAILRKVSDSYTPLDGAVFEILRYDHTLVSSTDTNGATTTSFTSGTSGVYFIDMLPYGTYYLHETTIPSGYKQVTSGDDGNWFILTVNENGVGYERVTDTSTTVGNTLSPEATKPD